MNDWSQRHLPNRCDMCAERKADVLRFGLIRRMRQDNGNQSSRGAGGIWLCEACWQALVPLRQRERVHPLRAVS